MNKIIFAIFGIALFVGVLGTHNVLAQSGVPTPYPNVATVEKKAVPDWVDKNFKWYGEGLIKQSDLLNSLKFLIDNGHMHLSEKAANDIHELRAENKNLRMMVGKTDKTHNEQLDKKSHSGAQVSPSQTKVLVAPSANPESEPGKYCVTRVSHKYTDENGNEFLMVPAAPTNSEDSSCWIRVSQVQSEKSSEDMVLKGSKIKENYADTSFPRQTPKTDFGSVMKAGISKGADSLEDRIFSLLEKIMEKKESEVERKLEKEKSSDSGAPNLEVSKLPATKNPKMARQEMVQDECAMSVALISELAVLGEEIQSITDDLERLQMSPPESDASDKTKAAYRAEINSLQAKLQILQERLESTQQRLVEISERINKNPDVTCDGYSDMGNLNLQTKMQQASQITQMMSNILKTQHDTAKAVLQNMK